MCVLVCIFSSPVLFRAILKPDSLADILLFHSYTLSVIPRSSLFVVSSEVRVL